MSFSQSSVTVSAGLSTGNLNFGERSVSNLTTQLGECRHQLGQSMSPGASDMMPPNNPFKQCRSTSDMDADSTTDHTSGPMKQARTCSFSRQPDLEMQMSSSGSFGSVVRSSSVVSDGRLGCSPTNAPASNAAALLCTETSLMPDARSMRSESILTCPPGSMSSYHQANFFRPLGLSLPIGGEAVNVMGLHETTHGFRPPFTMHQYRELRHQVLIFKYISNGMTVPVDLLIPIRNSLFGLGGIAAHHQLANIGWGNYHIGFASNTDPEPGRCRRTDGKKWRCAREVVPDQKYCERHMHRGRHRTRKAADSQTPSSISVVANATTPSSGSASSVNLAAALGTTPGGLGVAAVMNTRQYRPVPNLGLQCYSSRSSPSGIPVADSINRGHFQLPLQSAGPSGLASRDYRYLNAEAKLQVNLGPEQMLFAESSGSVRGFPQDSPPSIDGLSMLSSVSNSWRSSIPSKEQHSFLGSAFGAPEEISANPEPEGHPLRHFFDDWPRSKAPAALSWSNADDERSNRSSSTTQLSISIPMVSSDFTAANASSSRGKLSRSP